MSVIYGDGEQKQNALHSKPVGMVTDDELYSDINNKYDDAKGENSTWRQEQEKYYRLRMRVKKKKTSPFVGCSNIRMPTVETQIRKQKAKLISGIFSIRPIIQAIPSPTGNPETASKIEKLIDHLLVNMADGKKKLSIAIDQSLEKGFYLCKPFWRTEVINRTVEAHIDDLNMQEMELLFYGQDEQIIAWGFQKYEMDESELVALHNVKELFKFVEKIRSGKKRYKMKTKDVLYDYPDFALCPPERIFVPASSGFDPNHCEYVIHEFYLPFATIHQNAKYKGWSKEAMEAISAPSYEDDQPIESQKQSEEGIYLSEGSKNLVRIWEYYGWNDINGDGEREKVCVTVAPDHGVILRKIEIPFLSGKFPFVKLFHELIDDRWYSHRGIPELIEDIAKEIDVQHMQKIDSQTLRNTPMFLYRTNVVNPKAVQFRFGQGIPVGGFSPLKDSIQPLNMTNTNAEYSYKDEQMILESKIQELTGNIDFNLQSMINKREPRTASEVAMHQQQQAMMMGLDMSMLIEQLSDLANWFYELWCKYAPDNYEFNYFGNNDVVPVKISREELQGKYKIIMRANDSNHNPVVRIQKAEKAIGMLGNQMAMAMGIVTPTNIYQAYKKFFEELGYEGWQNVITDPSTQQPKPPPPPEIKITMDDLTDKEQAQVLVKNGIQPDIQGRHIKSQAKTNENFADRMVQIADKMQ